MYWQAISTIAVPVIGLLAAFLTRERSPRLHRRVKETIGLLENLDKSEPAHSHLSKLAEAQAKALSERESLFLARTLNKQNLGFVIVFGSLGVVGFYYLWNWAAQLAGSGWMALPIVLLVIDGMFTVVVIAGGLPTIYKQKDSAHDSN